MLYRKHISGVFTVVVIALLLFLGKLPAQYRCNRWTNRTTCEQYGCYWWNNNCYSYAPSCTQIDNESDCLRYGCRWYNNACRNQCHTYTNESNCESNGCYWYDDACHSDPPICPLYTTRPTCLAAGCYWYKGACWPTPPSVCSELDNEEDCTYYGCYWYGNACHSSPQLAKPPITEAPCSYPPFLSETVPPNVLVILDNSGSMNWPAYQDLSSSDPKTYDYGSYVPSVRYYGYADPDSYYQWATNRFEVVRNWQGTADPANKRFKGNFLNWMMSRRIDIARQVLVGGKCESRTGSGRKTLIWENPAQDNSYYKYWKCDDNCWWRFQNDGATNLIAAKASVCSDRNSSYSTQWTVSKKIQGPEIVSGLLQKVYDRVRIGIMHFNESEGGHVSNWIGSPLSSIETDIENVSCNTWTPLSETFYEATRYFQALTGYFTNANYAAHDPVTAWCQTQFVIYITDGEPTQDRSTPSPYNNWDNTDCDPIPCGSNPSQYPWSSNGSDYLNDVALWAHTTDLRGDHQSEQVITLYPVYCFGTAEDAIGVLRRAAKNGAFTDANGNNRPDLQSEWDANGDDVPDGYYEAQNGYQLESALIAIFINIMRQTSSAAAVSVVSTSDKGEGNVFQAYFSPQRSVAEATLQWIGELHALWIDQRGNLREDTDNDDRLHLEDDRILHIYFDPDVTATVVERWKDLNGDCVEDVLENRIGINDVASVWRAADWLYNASPGDRNIKAIVPKAGGGYEFIDFTTSNISRLEPHIEFGSTAQAESVVNYIRGVDYTGTPEWRSRTAGGKVWKLSDIVNSSPTYVGAPADRYDLLYNDASYRPFYQQYINRRGIIYVGGNDGLLHLFNAGKYYETGQQVERGYLDGMGQPLGKELMAFVPYNLLPHLKWLAYPDYCHIFYVDLKPKAFDAKVFPADSRHPNGWGTVLLCGLRFGGSPYTTSTGIAHKSSYLALDITDPTNISFMWEYTDDETRFTTSYPGVVKCRDKWFATLGFGPTSLSGSSSETSRLLVMDVADTSTQRSFSGSTNGHFADPFSVDITLNGSVDVLYCGESYWASSKWHGKIYRINTGESEHLADWTSSILMDLPSLPITAGGAVTVDDYGTEWVFIGSGRYFSDADESDRSDQYFIGVKDTAIVSGGSISFSSLIDVTALTVQQTDTGTYVYGYGTNPVTYDSLLVDMRRALGWKMKLTNGERVINRPLVLGGVVFFTTFKPSDDVCSFGGTSRLYAVDYRTGVPGETSILGMDENGWLYEFVELGEGVPSAPAAHVGVTEQAMIIVQLSTGSIAQQTANIISPKSKGLFWRGK